MVKAQALVSECDCPVQMAREWRQRSRHRYRHPELEWVLTVLEVGVTFCNTACIRRDVRKERLIQNARKALSSAVTTICKFDFSINGVDEIKAGIDGLQNALEECYAKG